MPFVRIELYEDQPEETKEELRRRVVLAVAEVLRLPLDHIQCVLSDGARRRPARAGARPAVDGDGASRAGAGSR